MRRTFVGTVVAVSVLLTLRDIHRGILPYSVEGAAKKQAVLEAEFRELPVPEWATPLDFQYSPRAERALIGRAFISKASFAEVEQYYDAELAKRGWVAFGEAPIREWGIIDYGGRARLYCKKPYEAELFYPGSEEGYAWTYTLTFSWPPSRECLLN